MGHPSQITGEISELTATIALMSNGWEVAFPSVDEPYDLVARDPDTGKWTTIQVKTIRRRTDRNNEMVIYATNGKGEPYTPDVCNVIAGVTDNTVYLVPCSGIREYWATDESAERKWTKIYANKTEAV
jgi:hypothetical protein